MQNLFSNLKTSKVELRNNEESRIHGTKNYAFLKKIRQLSDATEEGKRNYLIKIPNVLEVAPKFVNSWGIVLYTKITIHPSHTGESSTIQTT